MTRQEPIREIEKLMTEMNTLGLLRLLDCAKALAGKELNRLPDCGKTLAK